MSLFSVSSPGALQLVHESGRGALKLGIWRIGWKKDAYFQNRYSRARLLCQQFQEDAEFIPVISLVFPKVLWPQPLVSHAASERAASQTHIPTGACACMKPGIGRWEEDANFQKRFSRVYLLCRNEVEQFHSSMWSTWQFLDAAQDDTQMIALPYVAASS